MDIIYFFLNFRRVIVLVLFKMVEDEFFESREKYCFKILM